MKAALFSSRISANLGKQFTSTWSSNEEETKESYGCHTFVLFCELVEGEENKLTTFSTWTIMLGCDESSIISSSISAILGKQFTSTWSSNEEETKESYGCHTFVLFVS